MNSNGLIIFSSLILLDADDLKGIADRHEIGNFKEAEGVGL